MTIAALGLTGPAWAQGTLQPVREPFNIPTGAVGLAAVVVGAYLLTADGHTYEVVGDKYCVTEYSVNAGQCQRPMQNKTPGLLLVGAGAALTVIGFHPVTRMKRVEVFPFMSLTQLGATASVRW